MRDPNQTVPPGDRLRAETAREQDAKWARFDALKLALDRKLFVLDVVKGLDTAVATHEPLKLWTLEDAQAGRIR